MLLSNNFSCSNITTFTSDRTVDFTIQDNQRVLNNNQKEFLSQQLNFKLPEPIHICQVHGDNIIVADKYIVKRENPIVEADGLLTKTINLPLALRSADCLPVFLYDHKQMGIGLIHVGWRGSRKNIIQKAVRAMETHWQSKPEDIEVMFGPAIRKCCYEVGEEFKGYFPDECTIKEGRLYLDLPRVNRTQLIALGLNKNQFTDCGTCTYCNENYFSNRREGRSAGRMISISVIRNKQGV